MNITFIGVGYVGLVTAAVFADLGHKVWALARTPKKIEDLKRGIMPFYEPGLDKLVRKNLRPKRLFFTTDYKEAIPKADVVFICVGTPQKEAGEPDLSQVWQTTKTLAPYLKNGAIVACKSTVPPGTNRKIVVLIKKTNPKARFEIASCPEFLREGNALFDTQNPDRVIIGSSSKRAQKILGKLHQPLGAPIVLTSLESAEMIKYVSNAFLATKISFANAIANICESIGADVTEVTKAVGLDKRIGQYFLNAGVGWGGSCFPKDVSGLIWVAKNKGYDFSLLKEVKKINEEQARIFVQKVKKALNGNLKGKTLAILGLAFKPNTDDMREAPSIRIINLLQKEGAKIRAYDPIAEENARLVLQNVSFCPTVDETLGGADAACLVTEWEEFKNLPLLKIKKLLKAPIIIDGRNVFSPPKAKKLGFYYDSVGR